MGLERRGAGDDGGGRDGWRWVWSKEGERDAMEVRRGRGERKGWNGHKVVILADFTVVRFTAGRFS